VGVPGDVETVSTVSILLPLELVPLHKQLKFLSEAPLPVVFFLISNVLGHLSNA
jgi:hypothetical protein